MFKSAINIHRFRTTAKAYSTYAPKVCLIVGGRKGVGQGIANELAKRSNNFPEPFHIITTSSHFSNTPEFEAPFYKVRLDVNDKDSVNQAAQWVEDKFGKLDLLINSIGILHGSLNDQKFRPEKSVSQINEDWFFENFRINTYSNVMLAQKFCPIMSLGEIEQNPAVFAAISARIGTIQDNTYIFFIFHHYFTLSNGPIAGRADGTVTECRKQL